MLNLPINGKIQGIFNAFECFSSFSRQILFSRAFQDSPVYSGTFQAFVNPVHISKCTLECFNHGNKHYGSSLIWLHIVYNKGYQSTKTDDIAGNICCGWREKYLCSSQYSLRSSLICVHNPYYLKFKLPKNISR